ncbi:hypothetical protein FACS189426_06960 [Bacteroidia bacterium]|nr:hypothetical protein FACS189426_06960 [Bacteroidia bacterium]
MYVIIKRVATMEVIERVDIEVSKKIKFFFSKNLSFFIKFTDNAIFINTANIPGSQKGPLFRSIPAKDILKIIRLCPGFVSRAINSSLISPSDLIFCVMSNRK